MTLFLPYHTQQRMHTHSRHCHVLTFCPLKPSCRVDRQRKCDIHTVKYTTCLAHPTQTCHNTPTCQGQVELHALCHNQIAWCKAWRPRQCCLSLVCTSQREKVANAIWHFEGKAEDFTTAFGTEHFHCSNGWIDCFKQWHDLKFRTISGELESKLILLQWVFVTTRVDCRLWTEVEVIVQSATWGAKCRRFYTRNNCHIDQ